MNRKREKNFWGLEEENVTKEYLDLKISSQFSGKG